MKTNVAIFASGNGSNCENLLRHFAFHPTINIALVVCNNPNAKVLDRIKPYNVPSWVVDKNLLATSDFTKSLKSEYNIDFIVLAGFLLKVPDGLVEAYSGKMVNLHPALLPKYGGKGMYGRHVHEAVKANGETETGYTVHWVSSEIDGGTIIAQHHVALTPADTVDDIARKEHELEMCHFPTDIERILTTFRDTSPTH